MSTDRDRPFAVIEGPVEFRMGSPATETERIEGNEPLRRMVVPRRFAIATKEVTVEPVPAVPEAGRHQMPGVDAEHRLSQQLQPRSRGTAELGSDWYGAAALLQLAERAGGPAEGPVVLRPSQDGRIR